MSASDTTDFRRVQATYRNSCCGVTGARGPIGPQGYSGSQGSVGTQGFQGARGATGFSGPQGVQGPQGATGFRGATGFQGATGFTGSQGAAGFTGTQGLHGPQGATGFTGVQGLQGPQGATGFQGATGPQGVQGSAGAGTFKLVILNDGVAGPALNWTASHTILSGPRNIVARAQVTGFSTIGGGGTYRLTVTNADNSTIDRYFYFNSPSVHHTLPDLLYKSSSTISGTLNFAVTAVSGITFDANDRFSLTLIEY